MNGIHDMGGMDGMGPIEPEPNEPVFHEPWEGRVHALFMTITFGPWRVGRSWGSFRFELEQIPPGDYLRMTYYERWFVTLVARLLRSDFVTQAELESGTADPARPGPVLLPEPASADSPEPPVSPRFQAQQRVRARNLNRRGHTRLPRYARGKQGVVQLDHGVARLQDTDVDGRILGGGPRQHVYLVRFEGRELWGERASTRDAVYLDMWEDYLEPA